MATTEPMAAPAPKPTETAQPRPTIVVDPPKPAEKTPEQPSDSAALQKLVDKMGNELGELRRENRQLIDQVQQLGKPAEPAMPAATFEDDPKQFIKEAVGHAIQEQLGPQLQVLNSDLNERRGQTFDKAVSEVYPDWKETIAHDDFANWIKQSNARVQMYMIADKQFDSATAIELLKRFRSDQAEAQQNEAGALNAAGMVEGGGEAGGVQVYAASEIKALMERDPQAYKRWLASEGMQAYAEGRVDQNR